MYKIFKDHQIFKEKLCKIHFSKVQGVKEIQMLFYLFMLCCLTLYLFSHSLLYGHLPFFLSSLTTHFAKPRERVIVHMQQLHYNALFVSCC